MSKSTLSAANILPVEGDIVSAVETVVKQVAKRDMVNYAGFTFRDNNKKGDTVYKAAARAIGQPHATKEGEFAAAPAIVQRTITLAALVASNAMKVTKKGKVSPAPKQFLKGFMSDALGMSLSHHFTIPKTGKRTWANLDKDGVTPQGEQFFALSTGSDTTLDVQTWHGCSEAVAALAKGFAKGGRVTVSITDSRADGMEVVKLSLNFKADFEGAELKR